MVDSRKLILMSFEKKNPLISVNSEQTLDFYKSLVKLEELVVSWWYHYAAGRETVAAKIQQQIYTNYNFDVSKYYEVKKYGTY